MYLFFDEKIRRMKAITLRPFHIKYSCIVCELIKPLENKACNVK